MGTRPPLVASVKMSEAIICTGEAAWTQVDAACTVTADATYYKVGAASAKMAMAAGAAAGIQAYGVPAVDNTNIATAGYTHIKYWIRSSLAVAAGALKLGLSDAADASGTEYYVDIPALAADTWTRVCSELSTDQAALTSLSSIHLYLVTDSGAQNVYIDDIRLCKYVLSPTDGITLAETSTLGNTNAVTDTASEVFQFPFRARLASTNELPQDIGVTWYAGSPDAWASTDVEQGAMHYSATERLTDVNVSATSCSIVLGADLAAAEYIELMVEE